jgi:hypothetical protein
MSVKKEFAFKMVVDTGQGQQEITKVVKSLKEFDDRITELNKEVRTTDFGSAKFQELNEELQRTRKAQAEVIMETKKQTEALDESGKSATSLSETFSSMGGPIGSTIQSVKALNAGLMKLVLNPIGAVITALVLALTALYKAFTSTKAGAELLDQVMAGIGAAMDVLRDRVLKVGEALVKFFTGDFKGAFEAAGDSVKGLGSEIAAEFQEAMNIKKELQAIDDAQRNLNKTRALQNKLIADAKLKINDETLSYEERLAALESIRKEEIALAKQEEVLAERRFKAIQAQNALSDSSKEALDAEAQAYVVLQQAQQTSAQKQKELFDQEKALRDRQRAERKAAEAERAAKFKEANDKIAQYIEEGVQARGITRDEELEREKKQYEEALAIAKKFGQDTTKITESYRQQEKVINDKYDQLQLDKEKTNAASLRELEVLAAQNKLNELLLTNDAESQIVKDQQQFLIDVQEQQILDQMTYLQNKQNLTAQEMLELEKLKTAYLALQKQEKDASDQRKKSSQENVELRKQQNLAEQQAFGELAGTIVGIGKLLGDQTKENKALAIADALVNTYLGITQVIGQKSVLPSPFDVIAKIAQIAVISGTGFKAVQNIKSVPITGGGGGSGGGSSAAGVPRPRGLASGGVVEGIGTGTSDSVPAMLSAGETVINAQSSRIFGPTLSAINAFGGGKRFNVGGVVGMDQIQSLGNTSLGGGASQPIQAYVVSQNMTNSQMFDRAQKSRSTI